MRFAARRCVVIGGMRGIGAAVVRQLQAEGGDVLIGDVLDGSCDVTRPASIDAFFAAISRPVDVLVCVAGGVRSASFDTLTAEAWRELHVLNLDSVFHTVQAALPLLRQSKAASIVTVPSYQAVRPGPGQAAYASAKGGLLSLTRALAVDLGPAIRVNGVMPGQVESVRTDAYFAAFRDPEEARRRTIESFPLRRLGQPEDIAKAVAFLASSDASWITGTILCVDGGRDAAGLDLSGLR